MVNAGHERWGKIELLQHPPVPEIEDRAWFKVRSVEFWILSDIRADRAIERVFRSIRW